MLDAQASHITQPEISPSHFLFSAHSEDLTGIKNSQNLRRSEFIITDDDDDDDAIFTHD